MPTRRRPKKGGDANRKTARALLDFKDGLTAGEVKLLLAVATGESFAAIQGRKFAEKFPDLAAVLGMGRGARPQRATETRRGAQNRAEAVEGSRGRPGAAGRAERGRRGRRTPPAEKACTDGGEGGMILHVPADAANSAEVEDRDTIKTISPRAFRPSPLAASSTDSRGAFVWR